MQQNVFRTAKGKHAYYSTYKVTCSHWFNAKGCHFNLPTSNWKTQISYRMQNRKTAKLMMYTACSSPIAFSKPKKGPWLFHELLPQAYRLIFWKGLRTETLAALFIIWSPYSGHVQYKTIPLSERINLSQGPVAHHIASPGWVYVRSTGLLRDFLCSALCYTGKCIQSE